MAHSFPLEEGGSELAFSLPINAEGQGGDAAQCPLWRRLPILSPGPIANWKHRIPTLSANPTWRGVAVIFTLCRPIECFIWLRSTASQVGVKILQPSREIGWVLSKCKFAVRLADISEETSGRNRSQTSSVLGAKRNERTSREPTARILHATARHFVLCSACTCQSSAATGKV